MNGCFGHGKARGYGMQRRMAVIYIIVVFSSHGYRVVHNRSWTPMLYC